MISTETSEKRALARIKEEPGHAPRFTWEGEREGSWRTGYDFSLECECGKAIGYNKGDGLTTQTGAVSAHTIKAFNHHINDIRNQGMVSEPILIGRVKKQRVTNEVWVFHQANDKPDKEASRYGLRFYYPWNVLLKNTSGWRSLGGSQTKERAISGATAYLDKQSGYHEIEYVYKDSPGVEAPVATIVNSVTRLVQRASETKDNPIKLSELLADLDTGVKQLQILAPLRDQVQDRLNESLDLGI